MITRHPQLFIHKAQAMVNPFVRGELRAFRDRMRAARVRDNLIGNRVTHAVLFVRVAQQTNGTWVKFLRRVLLVADGVLVDLHGTGTRAACGIRFHYRVHRHQAVVLAINVEVEAEVVDMLVGGADNIMVDQRTVTRIVFRARVVHGFGLHAFHCFNAGCARIDTDGAIFVEDPVENVVVVTHGTNPAHNQFTTLGADVRLAHLLVLILRPCIAFENGNRARDLGGCAGVVGDGLVQQHSVGWRIFAARDRRGESTHAVVTGIQVRFEVPADIRVAVWHDHPAQRSFVHHFTFGAVIVIGHRGDHRPDAGVHAQVEIPVTPVDHVAGDGVVFTFRFNDIQRFHRRGDAVTAIVGARGHRYRDHRAFFQLHDFFLFQVDNRDQVFNRMRPVVAIAHVQITDDFQQTRILFQAVFAVKIAHGERGGDHFFRVVDTAFFQRFSVFGAGVNDVLHAGEVINQHHTVRVFDGLPGEDLFVLQINHTFDDVLAIQHDDIRFARLSYGFAFQRECPYGGFLRRVQ